MQERLLEALDDLIAFLEHHENDAWPPVLRTLRDRASKTNDSDRRAWEEYLKEFSRLFGGMGSLNDLTIYRVNGHRVADEIQANLQLQRLVARLFEEYQRVKWRLHR
jgi:hypothetical protein